MRHAPMGLNPLAIGASDQTVQCPTVENAGVSIPWQSGHLIRRLDGYYR